MAPDNDDGTSVLHFLAQAAESADMPVGAWLMLVLVVLIGFVLAVGRFFGGGGGDE